MIFYPRLRFRLMGLLLLTALVAVMVAYWRAIQQISVLEREMAGTSYRWILDEKLLVNVHKEVMGTRVDDVADLAAVLSNPSYDCSEIQFLTIASWQERLPTEKLEDLRGLSIVRVSATPEMMDPIPESVQRLRFNDTTGFDEAWTVRLSALPHLVQLHVDKLSKELIAAVDNHQTLEVLTVRSSSIADEDLQRAQKELDSVQVLRTQ